MPRLLSRLGRRPSVSVAERNRLLGEAIRLQRDLAANTSVIHALQTAGAPEQVAIELNAEAEAQVDRELASTVPLPASSRRPINYYFLLGVTPLAAPDQIHRAYRRKAKQVHPDRHHDEFRADQWQDLMTVVADASDVLTDPRKRRAYDVFWRERSKTVAMQYRKPGDKRGDIETRFLWRIAEMSELEEALTILLQELRRLLDDGGSPAPPVRALCDALEQYEGAMIEIRIEAQTLPDDLAGFSDRVRSEMQRKERLVRCLRKLVRADAHAIASHITPATDVLAEIREAQNSFELGTARPFI
jgi:curved DNA-binding protein CbpA